jgi:uncharacterized protein involved in oxidation of intracellular sulfur
MKSLFILNDPPYGTERVYNALRLAQAVLKKEPQTEVTLFLMADSVVAARAGQKTPDGYYNVGRMLKRVLAGNGKVLLCGTCMDARGLDDAALVAGARRSTMDELAAATSDADKGHGVLIMDIVPQAGGRALEAWAHLGRRNWPTAEHLTVIV